MKFSMRKIIFVICAGLFFQGSVDAQVTINNTMTPSQLVQNVLLGAGITVSNITYNGAPIAMGAFNGTSSNLGFNKGILLTTGADTNSIGPNNNPAITLASGLGGDPDLNLLVPFSTTYDACILEFDFVATTDTVKFRYIFGSDEYMEYVTPPPSFINDCFGFFISGPGISGPFSLNSQNIALIPSSPLPVSISNVNLNNNGTYYFDNGNGLGSGTAPDGLTVQYDGFTVPFTAVSAVQCGQTYHIKIAIADVGDDLVDSGVFLEAGSFKAAGQVALHSIPSNTFGGNDTTLIAGCGSATLTLNRDGYNIGHSDTVQMTIGGTAINGIDYNNTPSQLIFLPGQDSILLNLNAYDDSILGPDKTITLTVTNYNTCHQAVTSSITYLIQPVPPLHLTGPPPSTICVGDSVTLTVHRNGGYPGYHFSWTNTTSTDSVTRVHPAATTTYSVTVTDTCGRTKTIPVVVNVSTVEAQFTANQVDNNVFTFADNSVGSPGPASWNWNFGDGSQSSSQNPGYTYTMPGTYTISLITTNSNGCKDTAKDVVQVLPEFMFYAPNSFTPNGDGKNDIFKPNGSGIMKYDMKIFNRWGELIFSTTDFNTGWDGRTSNGEYAETGVYIVKFHVEGTQSDYLVNEIDHVNLIR
jgi:gliding motility-associated-like protein